MRGSHVTDTVNVHPGFGLNRLSMDTPFAKRPPEPSSWSRHGSPGLTIPPPAISPLPKAAATFYNDGVYARRGPAAWNKTAQGRVLYASTGK